jgi:F-type H+-transporting ATPase subunit delta
MAAVAQLYARAFADAAADAHLDMDAAMRQLAQFSAAFAESRDLRELMMNPSVPLEQKLRLLDAICEKIQALPQVRNFLAVLLQRDRMNELAEIEQETRAEMDRRSGVVEAEIVTARELNQEQRKQIEQRVAQMAGSGRVRAKYSQDKSLLGGVKVTLGSTVFDGTVIGQLKRMKQQLSASSSA